MICNLLEKFLNKRNPAKGKSLEREVLEGNQAAQLLRDGIFSQIVEQMRDDIITSWRTSPIRDNEAREHLRLMIKVLDSIVESLEQAYITGELAAKQLEDDKKRKHKK